MTNLLQGQTACLFEGISFRLEWHETPGGRKLEFPLCFVMEKAGRQQAYSQLTAVLVSFDHIWHNLLRRWYGTMLRQEPMFCFSQFPHLLPPPELNNQKRWHLAKVNSFKESKTTFMGFIISFLINFLFSPNYYACKDKFYQL